MPTFRREELSLLLLFGVWSAVKEQLPDLSLQSICVNKNLKKKKKKEAGISDAQMSMCMLE